MNPRGSVEGLKPREGGSVPAPRKYPDELRERALRLVREATVQFHLTHIYAKLGVSSRAELAAQFRDNETTETTPPGDR